MDLQLHRIALKRRGIAHLMRDQRLPPTLDLGAQAHAALSALFAPSPEEHGRIPFRSFSVQEEDSWQRRDNDLLYVYGYGDSQIALPLANALFWASDSRPVPAVASGTKLAFQTRVCPVVRTRTAHPGSSDTSRKIRELDAFLREVELVGPTVRLDREDVYVQWLRAQFEATGACVLEHGFLHSYQRERMYRTVQNGGVWSERPNVVLRGTLEVRDGAAFQNVLLRGVGRHRSYGFGLLNVRPVVDPHF